MIVKNKISLRKLFSFTKSNLLVLVTTTALSVLAVFYIDTELFKGLSYPAGFLGTALAFLVGFRNNSAYDRWWEARKVWGKLVNDSRLFSMKVIGLISNHWNSNLTPDMVASAKKELVYRHMAFVWSLNKHLRKTDYTEVVKPFLNKKEFTRLENEQNVPNALLKNQAIRIKELFEQKYLDDFRHMQFDSILENFNDALGKSERIKNTVFPMQYNWFMHYALWVFLFILPFSLVGYLGFWSVPFSLTIGYVFIMLEYVGKYIENPFENTVNDTPIDALSRTIEINLKQNLGETELPPAIEPVKGIYLY